MGMVGVFKFHKRALSLSLEVIHNPIVIELIVGLKPQRLINLNTINLVGSWCWMKLGINHWA